MNQERSRLQLYNTLTASQQRDKIPNKCLKYNQAIWCWDSNSGAYRNVEYLFSVVTPGPLWPRELVLVSVLYTGQIELFNHLLILKTFKYGK